MTNDSFYIRGKILQLLRMEHSPDTAFSRCTLFVARSCKSHFVIDSQRKVEGAIP